MSRANAAACLRRAAIGAAGALFLAPVLAEDGISGGFSFELQSDSVVSADSAESEETSTYITIEPAVSVPLTSGFSLNPGFVMEEQEFVSEEDEEDISNDYDFTVTELFVEWSGEGLNAYVGKFHPTFGVGWDVAPGIYGADFAGDYEIVGQLGAGIAVGLGEDESLALTFDLFKADTTALSACVMDDRCARTRREDGGPANTSEPSSFSLNLGSESLPALGGLGFQAGILRRAGGDGDPEDELGFALAVTSTNELEGGGAVEWMMEGVYMNNFEAGTDDVTYFTAGVAYLNGPWNVALATSFRNTDAELGESTDDNLFQLSTGYAFESGFSIDVGWRHGDEGGESSQTIGALIVYEAEF